MKLSAILFQGSWMDSITKVVGGNLVKVIAWFDIECWMFKSDDRFEARKIWEIITKTVSINEKL